MPSFTNLGDLIRRNQDLDKTAFLDLGGEMGPREFSFREIEEYANGIARALVVRGLSRGDRVAILSANRAEYVAALFGIMRAGFVAVPVNFKFPKDTVEFILADSGAKLVFCDGPRGGAVPAGMPTVVFGNEHDFLVPGEFSAVTPEPGEPAMFLYTSGSTGVPKGVVLSHQSHIWVVETRLGGQDLSHHRYLIAAPLYHMNALALVQLATAAHASVVLLPQFRAIEYIDAVERYRCTWLTGVPPMMAMMLREKEQLARADLSSVQLIRMGSAPVSESLMAALKHAIPHASITNAYGTTEAGPVVFGPHPDGLKQPELSVGYPHPSVRTRLVDADGQQSDSGELEMWSPALMNGYHNRPELPSPFTPDGFYRTGDVFRRDENGFHFFTGRTDDMFVSGGENIYPGDVERMLERHPDIVQACVVPVDDDIKGQKPVAFVIRKSGASFSEDDVKQYALAHAPAYQHPRAVWFIDALPLSSTNKIDRTTLKREAAARLSRS
ncbi:MAG TPA: class I adenylate-forming enzyme family protein [Micropepsaceae bacterium]|nr:class I adenylate-forming enzyme family protein [Micropepsaceae bacterium]